MRRLLPIAAAAALLCAPAVAHADPITIVATLAPYIGGTAAAAVATAAGYVASYGILAWSVVTTVYGNAKARAQARRAAADQRAQYNASLQDRHVTAATADPPHRLVYGRCITGGDIVAILTSDKASVRDDGTPYTKADGYKHLVIHFATHRCEAIHDLLVDGVPLGALNAAGSPTTGDFAKTRDTYRELFLGGGASASLPSPGTLQAWRGLEQDPSPAEAPYLSADGLTVTNPTEYALYVGVTYPEDASPIRVRWHLGTDDQAADASLLAECPTQWTANDRLAGLTYAVVRLDLEEQRFQGGPPNITADLSGKLVYDPRTGATAWSTNPALCVRDYLTAEMGFRCTAADIDDGYCAAAANACDVPVTTELLPHLGSSSPGLSVTAPRYTCNGAVTSDMPRESVLQDLCESMSGFAAYGGQWLIQAGAWTVPVTLPGGGGLTDDDLDGQIEIVQAGTGMDDAVNGVRGSYVPAGSAVVADFVPYVNPVFLAADQGVPLWDDRALPFTDTNWRAQNLARIFAEQNRDSLVIRYPAKLRAWPLRIGDRVTVTSAEYGFAEKVFRVTDWQFGLAAPVVLTLQEDAAAIYDEVDAATDDQAPNTTLPDPWRVDPIAGLGASSGTAELIVQPDGTLQTRVRVYWTRSTSPYVATGGEVRLRWRRVGTDAPNAWQAVAAVPGAETQTWVTGTRDGDEIMIEAVVVNSLGVTSGPVYLAHEVIGKRAPPANVANLTAAVVEAGVRIAWTPSAEPDYATTELRYGGTWASGVRIFEGAANTYTWQPPIGSYTVWAKHRDTTGNESAAAVSASFIVDAASVVMWTDIGGIALGVNQLHNADFALGLDGWSVAFLNGVVQDFLLVGWEPDLWVLNRGVGSGSGTLAFREAGGNTGAAGGNYVDIWSEPIAVRPGQWYAASAYTGAHRCQVAVFIWWIGADGATVGASGDWLTNAAEAPGGTELANYKRAGSIGAAPADAVAARLTLRKFGTEGAHADSYMFVARAQFEEVGAGATTFGPWSPGQIGFAGDLDATRNRIFRQASAPTGDIAEGDIWYDTDAGNAMHIRMGGAWVSVRDAGISEALAAAASAQSTADGKIDTYYAPAPPIAAAEGDLWFDTDDGNRLYRYTGGTWVLSTDTRIASAISAAATAQATADGKIATWFLPDPPASPAVGDLWYDTNDAYERLWRWSGSAWVVVSSVGAVIGVNLGGQITPANVPTYVAPQTVGTTQVADGAITAAVFTTTAGLDYRNQLVATHDRRVSLGSITLSPLRAGESAGTEQRRVALHVGAATVDPTGSYYIARIGVRAYDGETDADIRFRILRNGATIWEVYYRHNNLSQQDNSIYIAVPTVAYDISYGLAGQTVHYELQTLSETHSAGTTTPVAGVHLSTIQTVNAVLEEKKK